MGRDSAARAVLECKKVKTFCKVISQASYDGLLSRQQAKTLIGQAKSGQLKAAMMGLQTIMNR